MLRAQPNSLTRSRRRGHEVNQQELISQKVKRLKDYQGRHSLLESECQLTSLFHVNVAIIDWRIACWSEDIYNLNESAGDATISLELRS